MKKLLVVLLSSSAMVAFGTLAVDVAPALAAKCHCKQGPPGPRGPRGPRGFTGAKGATGAPGAAGQGLNNWDGFLTAPDQTQSVTVGKFTLFDSDKAAGTGCSDIYLSDNSSSSNATGALYLNEAYDSYTIDSGGNTEDITDGGGNSNDGGYLLNPFQFYLEDGSSMITGMVGNGPGNTEPNSVIPCVNVGGLAGS
ncbi:MAG TPA: hypothetical protein VE983_03325 [Solirubrobacteraceae bacterium]|nr:hypothetical protein [Solirubrobacteraceae bacterium]